MIPSSYTKPILHVLLLHQLLSTIVPCRELEGGVSILVSAASDSPINLNLKSRALSDALGHTLNRQNGDSSSSNPEEESSNNNSGISLDLSGSFDCCILGIHNNDKNTAALGLVEHPSRPGDIRRMVRPLWNRQRGEGGRDGEAGGSMMTAPNLFVGAEYDFRKVWFGMTRAVTTLSWKKKQKKKKDAAVGTADSPFTNSVDGSSSLGVNLSMEKGLLHPHDYSTQIQILRPRKTPSSGSTERDIDPPSVSLRYDTRSALWRGRRKRRGGKSATFAGRTALHKRVDLVLRHTVPLHSYLPIDDDEDEDEDDTSTNTEQQSYLSNRIPPPTKEWTEEGTWLPQITMTPGGQLLSTNTLGFREITTTKRGGGGAWYDGMRTGIRLRISRRIGWNALGLPSYGRGDDDGEDEGRAFTFVRLELSGLDGDCCMLRSVTFETALERLGDAARVTLLQESIARRP